MTTSGEKWLCLARVAYSLGLALAIAMLVTSIVLLNGGGTDAIRHSMFGVTLGTGAACLATGIYGAAQSYYHDNKPRYEPDYNTDTAGRVSANNIVLGIFLVLGSGFLLCSGAAPAVAAVCGGIGVLGSLYNIGMEIAEYVAARSTGGMTPAAKAQSDILHARKMKDLRIKEAGAREFLEHERKRREAERREDERQRREAERRKAESQRRAADLAKLADSQRRAAGVRRVQPTAGIDAPLFLEPNESQNRGDKLLQRDDSLTEEWLRRRLAVDSTSESLALGAVLLAIGYLAYCFLRRLRKRRSQPLLPAPSGLSPVPY